MKLDRKTIYVIIYNGEVFIGVTKVAPFFVR